MKNVITIVIKIIISLILSGSIIAGVIALFGYFDPSFSVGFFDLLKGGSAITWLLFGLTTAFVFFVLARIQVSEDPGAPCGPDGT